jgi:hypothetical protein
MTEERDLFIRRGEALLGRKIRYGSLGPSLFGILDIRDLSIQGENGENLLEIPRLRLGYSLLALIRGEGTGALRSLRLDGLTLRADKSRDGDLRERLSSLFSGDPSESRTKPPSWPAHFSLLLQGGDLLLSGPGTALHIQNLTVDGSIAGNRIGMNNFQGDVLITGVLPGEIRKSLFPLSTSFQLSGSGLRDLSQGNCRIDLSPLRSAFFSSSPLTFTLSLSPGALAVRSALPSLEIGVEYRIAAESLPGKLSARFRTEDLNPSDLVILSGPLLRYNPFLNTSISGEGTLSLSPGSPDESPALYSADLRGVSGGDGGVSFALKGSGRGDAMLFDVLEGKLDRGEFLYSGLLSLNPPAPQGRLLFRHADAPGREELRADMDLTTENGVISLRSSEFSAGKSRFTSFALDCSLEEGTASFSAVLRGAPPPQGIPRSASPLPDPPAAPSLSDLAGGDPGLSFEGFYDSRASDIQGRVIFSRFLVEDCLNLVEPFLSFPGFTELAGIFPRNLRINSECFVSSDMEHFLYNAPELRISYRGEALVEASFSGTDQRIEIQELRFIQRSSPFGPGSPEAFGSEGFIDFSNPLDVSFLFQVDHREFAYELEGVLMDQRSLNIWGSYGISASVNFTDLGGFSGYLEAASLPVSWGNSFARVTMASSFKYDSPALWYVDMDTLEAAGIETPVSPITSVNLRGHLDQGGCVVPELTVFDNLGAFTGQAQAMWQGLSPQIFWDFVDAGASIDAGAAIAGGANPPQEVAPPAALATSVSRAVPKESVDAASDAADSDAAESGADAQNALVFLLSLQNRGNPDPQNQDTMRIRVNYRDSHLEMEMALHQFPLSRALRIPWNPVLTGTMGFRFHSWQNFSAGLDLESLSFRLGDRETIISARVDMDQGQLSAEKLHLRYGSLTVEVPDLEIDREKGSARFSASTGGVALARGIEGSFRAEASFTPPESWFRMKEAAASISGILQVDRFRLDDLETKSPSSFIFRSTAEMISLSGGPSNFLRARLAPDGAFYLGLAAPAPLRGSLIGTINPRTIDLKTRNLYIDLPALWRFVPFRDTMAITGGFFTADLEIRGPLGDPEFFGVAEGMVRAAVPPFLPEEIGPLPVKIAFHGDEMSFGPLKARTGSGAALVQARFFFDRWIPSTVDMDLSVSPLESVPFRVDIQGIQAAGLVSGNLHLAVEQDVLNVTGTLTGSDTEISLKDQDALPEMVYMPVTMDLNLIAGRKVEFLWPYTEMPILHAYAKMGTGMNIKCDLTSAKFSVLGDVELRSGEIYYFQRNFFIREGTLSFHENEIHFGPRISARAEMRDQGEDGLVTITMVIDDSPLSNFTLRLESNPPLSQVDIFSILGQSITSTGLGLPNPLASSLLNAINVSSDFFTQFGVIRLFERTIRDWLHLDMFSVRTHLLQNTMLQVTGLQSMVDRNGGVGNYFDNTTVFFGKYIGSNMFIQVILPFRYNPGRGNLGDYTIAPDMGFELHNPFFDIRWNIVPLHWDTRFVADQSITLTWRRSF